jgi:ketosteroid isomerase-like protein
MSNVRPQKARYVTSTHTIVGGTMTSGYDMDTWNERADRFCKAWSSDVGRPDFDTLSKVYAADADVVIYDTLPPIQGFRGFEQMRQSIYPALTYIHVRRTGPIDIKCLADCTVVVTCYPFHLSYGFSNGTGHEIEARISEVWERRADEYVIVHEHPSTVYALASTAKAKFGTVA